MPEHFQDELDRRLMAAIESVDVPVGLKAKIVQALDAAMLAEHQGLVQLPNGDSQVKPASQKRLFNRRNWLAATVAAGVGGTLLGYRQLTQPLSQLWLAESCAGLLAQIEPDGSSWHSFAVHAELLSSASLSESTPGQTSSPVETEVAFLREVGFFRQVRTVGLAGFCELRPPRSIDKATAYHLGADGRGGFLTLLDLVVVRGVLGVSRSLTELPQSRSDAYALAAMQAGDRLLVMAGHVDLNTYILRGQTI